MARNTTSTAPAGDKAAQEASVESAEAVLPPAENIPPVDDGEIGTVAPAGDTATQNESIESAETVLPPEQNIPTVDGEKIGTVVPEGETVSDRKAVVFLGPYHNYSRADMACFEAEIAAQLVERNIAVWPKDAKKALSSRPGEFENDLDIG